MSAESITLKYTGSIPGANTNEYTLLDSETAFGTGVLKLMNAQRLVCGMQNIAAGTLKFYRKRNEDTAYVLIGTQAVAAATTGSGTLNVYDYDIAPYSNIKLTWSNSGSTNQSALFTPEMTILTDRHTGV